MVISIDTTRPQQTSLSLPDNSVEKTEAEGATSAPQGLCRTKPQWHCTELGKPHFL